MSNLQPKKDENGNPTSISQVSRLLRGKKEENPENKVENVVQQQEKKPVKQDIPTELTLVRGTELENMLLKAKQKRGQNIERRPIMVDSELYSIFAMLKAKKMVPAAGLVSMICRNWVIENKAELETILGQKINVQ